MIRHSARDLFGNDGADFAKVFPNRFDLECYPHQEFKVGFHVGNRAAESLSGPILVALADEVKDLNFVGLLTVTIHTPVPLFHAVGIPRDLIVNESGAKILEAQTF